MGNHRGRETVIGAVTVGVMALVLWLNAADRDEVGEDAEGYLLEAVFQRTDGLGAGADVRVAGLNVGRVTGQVLDEAFRAHVDLRIESGVGIPIDSAAVIETDGLLGSKYIEIQPGGAEEMLEPGQRVEYTQGSVVIEDLMARIVAQAKAKRGLDAREPMAEQMPDSEASAEADGAAGAKDGDSPFPSLLDPMPESDSGAN